MWSILRTGLFGVLACAAAEAGGVHVVEAGGTERFGTIQGAVDAAADGDVLLVSSGTYTGFSVVGKGLSILAAPGHEVLVAGKIELADLPASSMLLLSGLHVEAPRITTGLEATQCLGWLRIQDCEITGGDNVDDFLGNSPGSGLRLESCARVSIESSVLRGGGNDGDLPGGLGLDALDSTFSVHGSEVRGGHGINDSTGPSHGGHACVCAGSSSFLAQKSTFRGGDAAHGCEVGGNANGGSGLVLGGASSTAINCSIQGGLNELATCWPGGNAPAVVGCCLQTPLGTGRTVTASAVAGDRRRLAVEIRGLPGDLVWLLASDAPAFEAAPSLSGTWLIERPTWLPAAPLGVVPGSGLLATEIELPTIAPGSVVQEFYLQVLARSTQGQLVLGSSRGLALLETHSAPDCDGDGVQDFLATIDGSTPDANENLVPDACDWSGPDWHVDASAAAGGNGAAGAPFRSLAQGFAAASSGDRILVAPALYAGPENRDLGFLGRDLEVVGVDGAATTVVDCEAAGRAFLVTGGTIADARIEGFTIRNGDGDFQAIGAQVSRGGGIYVGEDVTAEISSCAIEDCQVGGMASGQGFGGGIYTDFNSSVRVIDTDFRRNRASASGSAIYLDAGLHSVTLNLVRACTFVENEVTIAAPGVRGGTVMVVYVRAVIDQCHFLRNDGGHRGGAIHFLQNNAGGSAVGSSITHSTMLENSALEGGAIYYYGSSATAIESCLIAGNRATEGGGVRASNYADLALRHCTVVGNESTTPGAGVCFKDGDVSIANCILWRNVGPLGYQVANLGTVPGTLLHCFVSSGANGVRGPMNLGPVILTGDPGCVDPDGPDGDPLDFVDNDYRLAPGSICIDAGSNAYVSADVGDIDGDGDTLEPNPLDLALAPRRVDDPAAPDTGAGSPPLVDLGAFERQP